MISSVKEFNLLIDRACATDCVGLDTEFIWERTYYPKLGLIQLALSDEECFLIDPLAIKDLTPLARLLANPDVVKILHDAPQDLMILNRVSGVVPQNVFDTRVAAGFSGLSSTISLADLINILLEIDLPKTETRTNWLNRPLNSSQVDYALDDVRYLRALRVLLLARIIVPEIREWLGEEMKLLSLPEAYELPPDDLRYLKIKGSGSLDRRSLAVLRNLAGWREREARTRNQPRGHIVNDKTLLTIARERTDSLETITASNLLSEKKAHRYSRIIIDAVRDALALDDGDLPETNRRIRLNTPEMSVYQQLLKYLEKVHQVQGIDPHIVGNHSEFKKLVKHHGKNSSRLPRKFTAGWRKQLLDRFLHS
jgi:ribonuclease D